MLQGKLLWQIFKHLIKCLYCKTNTKTINCIKTAVLYIIQMCLKIYCIHKKVFEKVSEGIWEKI